MAFVDLKGVSLTYRMGKETTLALADATFSIDKGEFIAVVGPSGCGKSTIMKLVTGLLPASSGEVRVAGEKVTGPIKGVGMAFQNPTLMPWRTTMDNILLPMEVVEPHKRNFRRNRAEYEERAMKLLRTVGLADFARRYPWQLSGGMQQRSNLCRALIHEPELLMLDEPFGALDAFTREELWGVMQALWLEKRFTGVLVTHDLREAVYLADTVYVMSKRPGRIVLSAPDRHPAAALARHDLRAAFRRHRARAARPHLAGACMTDFRREALRIAMPWLATAILLVIWELACIAFDVPEIILPKPTKIFTVFVARFDILMAYCWDTLWTTVIGFLLAIAGGLLLGLAIGASPFVYSGLYPLLIAFNAIPKVALVPILMIWVGVGSLPAVITAFVISFFPIVVNVATGLATIEPEMRDVLRSLGATQTEILTKVGIPRAMPYLFASLKVAITLAFIGSVISETVGGNNGIGFLMLSASARNDAPTTFAGLFAIAIMGVVMYAICAVIEKRMTRWAFRGELVS